MSDIKTGLPADVGLQLPPEMFKGFAPEPDRWYSLELKIRWVGDGPVFGLAGLYEAAGNFRFNDDLDMGVTVGPMPRGFWEDFAEARTAGDVVEVANIIADADADTTAEETARRVIPAVIRLLDSFGVSVPPPAADR